MFHLSRTNLLYPPRVGPRNPCYPNMLTAAQLQKLPKGTHFWMHYSFYKPRPFAEECIFLGMTKIHNVLGRVNNWNIKYRPVNSDFVNTTYLTTIGAEPNKDGSWALDQWTTLAKPFSLHENLKNNLGVLNW